MFLKILLILILLFFGQIKAEYSFLKIINLLNFCLIGSITIYGLLQKHIKTVIPVYMVLVIILTGYFLSAQIFIKNSNNVNLTEPIDEGYVSDEMDFLKTFYLMKSGEGFYPAFKNAIVADARFDKAPNSVIAWRLPTVYKIWSLVSSNGKEIRTLFLVMSMVYLVSSFLIIKKLTNPYIALFSPYLLIPYLLDTLYTNAIFFIEWWGLFFFVFGLCALFYNKTILTFTLLIISVIARELFIVPVLPILILYFINKKRPAFIIIFIFLVLIFYLRHFQDVGSVIGSSTFSPIGRIHEFDKNIMLVTFAFLTRFYGWAILRIGTVFIFFSLFSLIILKIFNKNSNSKLIDYSLLSFLPLIILFPFLGTRATELGGYVYSDYWGIMIVPLAIIFSPLVLSIDLNAIIRILRKIQGLSFGKNL